MRIVEKKCPNCGASLEFDENAKSCKCEYCKRSFEIERENNTFGGDYNYSLTEKTFNVFLLISFIVVFVFIGVVAFMVFTNIHFSETAKGSKLYTNVEELSSYSLSAIDSKAPWNIESADVDLDEYSLEMQVKREKLYVAYNKKDKKNAIVAVYKATYKKLFNADSVTILVPIIYNNVEKSDVGTDLAFAESYVKGPEYYFNMEHSEYALGYKDLETLEKDIIDSLKKDGYKITKK